MGGGAERGTLGFATGRGGDLACLPFDAKLILIITLVRGLHPLHRDQPVQVEPQQWYAGDCNERGKPLTVAYQWVVRDVVEGRLTH